MHYYGDIADTGAMRTGGHYIGDCGDDDPCRPEGVLQEVGMLGDGYLISVEKDIAVGSFRDSIIKLSGKDSIIGRSIVVHGNEINSAARVAQCVIGTTRLEPEHSDAGVLCILSYIFFLCSFVKRSK